jgi:hypothetical protein
MSAYTSGNKAPTLMAQAPNRVGNIDKHPAKKGGGVTAVTRPQGSTAYSGPHQGAAKAGGNPTGGRGQKVMVSKPECYDVTPRNDAYMNKSTKNYLG